RVEGAWVFGGVERTPERRCFLFVVEKRDATTLNEIIKKCVLPGSIVITDGWKGYNFLRNDMNYRHYFVNHSISFITMEGHHTNTIEGTWNGIKLNIPVRHRTKLFLQNDLFEFIWRRQNKNNIWEAALDLVS
ncbi:hypothetical protein H311_04027, partial [Anncaliia algerae PRA109]